MGVWCSELIASLGECEPVDDTLCRGSGLPPA